MREVNRSFSLLFFFFSIRYQTLISDKLLLSDIGKFILALFRPEILSNQSSVLWLAMNTSKEVNSSFSLLYFSVFVIRR